MAERPKARARSPSRPPPPPAIFYGPVGPGNPVVDSFEKDLHECLSVLRRNREAEDAGSMSQELHRRGGGNYYTSLGGVKPPGFSIPTPFVYFYGGKPRIFLMYVVVPRLSLEKLAP
ncbi:UNVERIFIED_CONTAM: hypothetical protein K2H54_074402 [Gekko kuhli]